MRTRSKRMLNLLVVLLAVLACSTFSLTGDALAGKGNGKGKGGDGGADPAGVIYFKDHDTNLMFRINADGSNATLLPLNVNGTLSLSDQRHAGAFWFLQTRVIENEFYPDGDPRRELFALREDDPDDVFTIQLTNDSRLEIGNSGLHLQWASLDGVKDVIAAFGAIRWDLTTGTVIGAGIYEAPISYDGQDNVEGLLFAPDPDDPIVVVPVEPRDTDGDDIDDQWRPGITGLDYAPDGSMLTYSATTTIPATIDSRRLFVVDLNVANPVPVSIADTEPVGAPAWSHDGSRIAFNSFEGIQTIAPDGSALEVVVPGKSNKSTQVLVRTPNWSPDDAHLSYRKLETNFRRLTTSVDLFRISASGKDETNVTQTGSSNATSVGWRK